MIKRWEIVVSALALAVVLLAMPAGYPAEASSTDTPEYQDVAYVVTDTFPVPDDGNYDDGFSPLSASIDCTRHVRGYEVSGYNSFGNWLWTFGASLRTCTRNGKVVHKKWGPCWGSTAGFPSLWKFKGCEVEAQSGQNLPRAYIWRQWRGHFGYCVTWVCKSKDPWVYIGGRGDGTFGTNGGAG